MFFFGNEAFSSILTIGSTGKTETIAIVYTMEHERIYYFNYNPSVTSKERVLEKSVIPFS